MRTADSLHVTTDRIMLELSRYWLWRRAAMAEENGVTVAKCPIGLEGCFVSCYWRKNNRCYFKSQRGRRIMDLKEKRRLGGLQRDEKVR